MRSNKITFTIGPTTIGHYYKIHTRRKFAHSVRILFFETFLGRLYVMQYMKFEPNEAWVAQILIEPFQRFTQKTVFELVFYSYIFFQHPFGAPSFTHNAPGHLFYDSNVPASSEYPILLSEKCRWKNNGTYKFWELMNN